jgi:hypothetical protein
MATLIFCSSSDSDCSARGISHGTYVNGSNKVPCDTGNGATSCLAGKFTILSGSGEVSAAPPGNCDKTKPNFNPADCVSNVGVQLIH